ncbi:hypothetical protein ABW19_dt0205438 [Dactylella cylindrospora]|nr:hypothetical protein ABW19_dt0205438 [Dactylella cylindrospora]
MGPLLLPYINFTNHETFNSLASCALISIAVLITGLISYARPQWFTRKFALSLQTKPTSSTTPTTQIDFQTDEKRSWFLQNNMLTYLRSPPTSSIIPSPEKTLLPELTLEEQAGLAYHPDSLPGGRWLNTPCGRIRVYEFGPENGKKVLFVHGISTPSIVARDMLTELAMRGCRIMVFDLPGRGYSECCSKTPQDMRLYSALILMVVTSSTAPGSFLPINLLGYSLGGGICVSFAAQFPHLVSSIAVFSSGGLIPYSLAPWGMKCSMCSWMPVWLADILLTTKLKGEEDAPTSDSSSDDSMASSESAGRKPVDIFSVIKWQNRHQRGFINSYINAMRNAPVFDQVKEWTELGRLLREGGLADQEDGTKSTKMLAIYGEKDDLTPPMLLDRIEECVGREHLKKLVVKDGGHEIVVFQWETIVQAVVDFWNL